MRQMLYILYLEYINGQFMAQSIPLPMGLKGLISGGKKNSSTPQSTPKARCLELLHFPTREKQCKIAH